MADVLKDLAKKGCKILQDTKQPRREVPKAKAIPLKNSAQDLDIHQIAVRRFVKEKPSKKHILEFFETIIQSEETKL